VNLARLDRRRHTGSGLTQVSIVTSGSTHTNRLLLQTKDGRDDSSISSVLNASKPSVFLEGAHIVRAKRNAHRYGKFP
jgi:hypothetical protein